MLQGWFRVQRPTWEQLQRASIYDVGRQLPSAARPMGSEVDSAEFDALERFSAVHIAVSQPFLNRSSAENGGKLHHFRPRNGSETAEKRL